MDDQINISVVGMERDSREEENEQVLADNSLDESALQLLVARRRSAAGSSLVSPRGRDTQFKLLAGALPQSEHATSTVRALCDCLLRPVLIVLPTGWSRFRALRL